MWWNKWCSVVKSRFVTMAATGESTDWPEQKPRAGLAFKADDKPLKIDVIDLTLLLKSMGLKLEFLNFEEQKSNVDTFSVDIKCNRSGVRAKLSYDLVECTCPEKDEKEASFWEVQGTGPKAFSKGKNDASSNLLPEVSENCSLVSKAMLTNLLEYYRNSMKCIERGEDVLNSPLRVATPKICVTSPGLTSLSSPPRDAPYADRNAWNRSTDSDSKMDPALSPMKPKVESAPSSSGASSQHDDTKSNTSLEGIEINNATRELYKAESEEKIVIQPTPEKPSGPPDDSSFANSEAMQALITSSPNEKIFESLMRTNQNDERDANVIQCLQQARLQIDAALLVMKLNNPGQDITQTSVLTTTPQTVVRKSTVGPKFPDRVGSFASINRRMSLPGPIGRTPDASKPSTILGSGSLLKKKVSLLAQTATSKLVAGRGDTPRPNPAQIKAVTALRKTNSASSVLAPKAASSVSAPATKPLLAKKTVAKSVVGSVRPPGTVKPVATAGKATAAGSTAATGAGKK